jgi:hypothetical protein
LFLATRHSCNDPVDLATLEINKLVSQLPSTHTFTYLLFPSNLWQVMLQIAVCFKAFWMLQLKWYGKANHCTYPLLFLAQRSLHTAVLLQQVYDIYSASVVWCCGVKGDTLTKSVLYMGPHTLLQPQATGIPWQPND